VTLAIVCTGQGAQHPQMLASPLLREAGGLGLTRTLEAQLATVPGWSERLAENRVAQPLLCAWSLAAWRALAPRISEPALFLGYSVGELAAHALAGGLGDAALVAVAAERARLMDGASSEPGAMLAVRGLARVTVEPIATHHRHAVAIVNGRDHLVLGGPAATAGILAQAVLGAGATTVRRLPVEVASHTPALSPAREPFRACLEASPLGPPRIPVIAGIDALPVLDRAEAIRTLSAQLDTCLRWDACVEAAVERGMRVFLELGPGRQVASLIQEIAPRAQARSLEDFRSLEGAAAWVERALAP
jgi:[acyl-carrier-protein] S-malonyltransferase